MFGILGYYEGHKDESENTPAVYRLDGQTGQLAVMADDVAGPNGLAFSPDEKTLYVVASRAMPHRTILAYDVTAGGTKLGRSRVLIDAGPGGSPDGFRVDVDGNLWCGWGMGDAELDGVRVFSPSGQPIGHIALPGALREPVLRRPPPEPPLHGGESRALLPLREHAGRGGRVGSATARRRPATGQGVLSSSRHSCRIRGRIQPRRR